MHNEHKRQSPYRGMWVILIMMIVPPILCYAIVSGVLAEFSKSSEALDLATAKALGCGFGFLFHMICVLSGVLTAGWEALKYRIREFFENLIVGVGYAFSTYWEDMRTDGVTFIIYLSIILVNMAVMVDGILEAIALLT